MKRAPTKEAVRAAKLLAKRYLPYEARHRWPLFLDTLSCESLALRLACRDLVKTILKEIRRVL